MTTESDPDAALRDRLAEAIAREAAFGGWTRGSMRDAAEKIGAADNVRRLFPGGPTDVLSHLSRRADERTVEQMEKEAGELRTRDRIALGVKLRIQNTVGGKESVRRGLALLALPFNGPLAFRMLYRTTDAIWHAAGDKSTDFNFYSKRALLGGVFSSTVLYWLNDRSEGDQATWDFLDRRIEDVMRFEKFKSEFTSWTGPRRPAAHR